MSVTLHHRARVAALTRSRASDGPELLDARRNLRAELLADRIRTTVDAWPPLAPEQRARLAALLLRPNAGGDRGGATAS